MGAMLSTSANKGPNNTQASSANPAPKGANNTQPSSANIGLSPEEKLAKEKLQSTTPIVSRNELNGVKLGGRSRSKKSKRKRRKSARK
jgi:hypothetical protein